MQAIYGESFNWIKKIITRDEQQVKTRRREHHIGNLKSYHEFNLKKIFHFNNTVKVLSF